MTGLGTSWDKRLTYGQWEAVVEALMTPRAHAGVDELADPIALFARRRRETLRVTAARRRATHRPGGRAFTRTSTR